MYNYGTNDIDSIPYDEQLKLINQYKNSQNEDEKLELKNKIVRANVAFVVMFTKRLIKNNVNSFDYNDFYSVGCKGLADALDRFDPSCEVKFLSFARFYIIKEVYSEVNRTIGGIKLPSYLYKKLTHIEDFVNEYKKENNGKAPSDDIVGKKFSISKRTVELIRLHKKETKYVNLDDNNFTYSHESNHSRYSDPSQPEAGNVMQIEEINKIILNYINSLDAREKEVILSHYGFAKEQKTLAEIGRTLNVVRERARQLNEKALSKLKMKMQRQGFNESLLELYANS